MLTLPYIAGFFDGEGSIGIYHDGGKRPHLRTQLAQNICPLSEGMFSYLVSRWGGNLSRSHNKNNTCFNWQLNSKPARAFLHELSPHLLLKKWQADIAVAWFDGRPEVSRNNLGHSIRIPENIDNDVIRILKRLKRNEVSETEYLTMIVSLNYKKEL